MSRKPQMVMIEETVDNKVDAGVMLEKTVGASAILIKSIVDAENVKSLSQNIEN